MLIPSPFSAAMTGLSVAFGELNTTTPPTCYDGDGFVAEHLHDSLVLGILY